MAAATVTQQGADGRHQVVIATPDFHGKSRDVFRTADDAASEFERRVQELREGADGSGLYRVSLYQDGELIREELVVRAIPNLL